MKPKAISILGISSVSIFLLSLLVFGLLHPHFNFLDDYISSLGYIGNRWALWWNILGFALPGTLLMIFGYCYGVFLKDKLAGLMLSIFGLGFGLTALPFNVFNHEAQLSKAHILAITLGLAGWLFGLARLAYNKQLDPSIRKRANIAAGIMGILMIGSVLQLWSEPIAQRLVGLVIISWTLLSSLDLEK